MPRFRAVLTEHGYDSSDLERSIIEAAGGELVDAETLPLAETLKLCAQADAILCRRLVVTADMLRQFRRCRILVRYGVGTDNIDVSAATALGIMVGHVPVYCVDEVSTHAIALLLACVRRLVGTHRKMAEGGWDVHREEPIHRLAGRTLGLVGLGNIGRAVAGKLQNWNLRILAADPYVGEDRAREVGAELTSLNWLCQASDFVSLHCPLLPETHHLFDADRLALMKPGCILVNTARGPLIDGAALLQALEAGPVAQAGLDVFEEEPLPARSPFAQHPDIVVTDHTAWYSEESQRSLQRKAAEEVARVGTGQLPVSLANPEVLDRLGRRAEWTVPEHLRWQLARQSQSLLNRGPESSV